MLGEAVVALPLGDVIDFAKERARLEKDLKKAQDEIARFDAKLNNEQFVAKAPEEVLEEQREKRGEATALEARLREAVAPWPILRQAQHEDYSIPFPHLSLSKGR